MCLPAAVLSLRLCCVATKVAGWNRGCGFAERFQQIALFNCKEFDYSERSRFRTFRLFFWTKITYLLDEINIYYMDPQPRPHGHMSHIMGVFRSRGWPMPGPFRLVFFRRDIWPWGRGCMDPVPFSMICLNMTRVYHLDRLDIYILLNHVRTKLFLLNHVCIIY